MSIATTVRDAVQAANKVAATPGAPPAQRLAALLQLQRHVTGLVESAKASA